MKNSISFLLLLLISVTSWGQSYECLMREYHQKEIEEYLKIKAVRLDYLSRNPLPNTVIVNRGDSIVELFSPPIGDQGIQNSCNAWALGYGCGTIHAYSECQDSILAKRSPAFIFNLRDSNCINNLSLASQIGYDMCRKGVCAYNLMPYDENDCTTKPDSIQLSDAALNILGDYAHLNSNTNVNEYKQILRSGYPIAAGTRYLQDLSTKWNNSSWNGYWCAIQDTSTLVGHSMCIVGYNDSIDAFKVMNSWGTNGGDNGFLWVSYGLVQNGVFEMTYVFEQGTYGKLLTIEGPTILSDSSWYYVRHLPHNVSITWNITNNTTNPQYTLVSSRYVDSVYVANRSNSLNPWNPFLIDDSLSVEGIHPPLPVHRGTLSVSISCGTATYTAQKTIRESKGSLSKMPRLVGSTDEAMLNIRIQEGDRLFENGQTATLSLIHPIYGRMRTQRAYDANSQMSIADMPRGVYILLLQQNGRTIAETKVMMP